MKAHRVGPKTDDREERLKLYLLRLERDSEFRETVKESVQAEGTGMTPEEFLKRYVEK